MSRLLMTTFLALVCTTAVHTTCAASSGHQAGRAASMEDHGQDTQAASKVESENIARSEERQGLGEMLWQGQFREQFKDCPWATPFELRDQFKEPYSFTIPRERVTVLMFADRAASDHAEPWVNKLWDIYGERIDMEGVGVGRWIPFFTRPVIRMLVRKATDHPIMLDWNGNVAKEYRYERHKFILHIIEPGGRVVRTLSGPPTEENVDTVCKEIDRLLEIFENKQNDRHDGQD